VKIRLVKAIKGILKNVGNEIKEIMGERKGRRK
jgi:hypothetical protein